MLPCASGSSDSAGKDFCETTMVIISSGAAGMSARKAASEASKKGAGRRSRARVSNVGREFST